MIRPPREHRVLNVIVAQDFELEAQTDGEARHDSAEAGNLVFEDDEIGPGVAVQFQQGGAHILRRHFQDLAWALEIHAVFVGLEHPHPIPRNDGVIFSPVVIQVARNELELIPVAPPASGPGPRLLESRQVKLVRWELRDDARAGLDKESDPLLRANPKVASAVSVEVDEPEARYRDGGFDPVFKPIAAHRHADADRSRGQLILFGEDPVLLKVEIILSVERVDQIHVAVVIDIQDKIGRREVLKRHAAHTLEKRIRILNELSR